MYMGTYRSRRGFRSQFSHNRSGKLKSSLLPSLLSACAFLSACGISTHPSTILKVSVSGTNNPLVAQYTVGSGCAGQVMVEFGPDTSYGRRTAWYPIPSFKPLPILVAGMRASTTYHMRAQRVCSGQTDMAPDTTFTTGALPAVAFPALQVSRPTPSQSQAQGQAAVAAENPGIEMITVPVTGTPIFFTDRDGNTIWYYDVGQANYPFVFKLLPNGHILLTFTNPSGSTLREIDLAGNTIREMDIYALQQKVQNAGYDFVPGGFHHDILPLANGHTLVLVDCGKSFTDLSGYPGTINVQGDAIIDLDPNWNPVWAWNSFDHLDVNRHLNGLPDWTHGNALVYSPDDGNILISMRHQSWVLKIDYNNGMGTGNVLWRLGYQGDFALTQYGVPTIDPSVWFSFQHFPSLVSQSGSQTTLAIWDNGDDRVLNSDGEECIYPGTGPYPPCYSRATIFQVDESAMVADLQWADTISDFSNWGGSINQLGNGNVEFDINAPAIPPATGIVSEVQEVTRTSAPQVIWKMDILSPSTAYRAYRVPSLYPGATWQY
jgi:arylsulfate sulfotransferase